MEPDCYLVEVIHYLNPHLIWVLNRSNSTLEQIGVYGVLPLDRVLELDTQSVTTKPCDEWRQASIYVLKKVFMDATEVCFQPTYIDRRSSIFDTNIHKYGELLIKKEDGKQRKLSSYLTKSMWAAFNEAAFHVLLGTGLAQTRLTSDMTNEVMKIIKLKVKDHESVASFNKQTTIYQASRKLEQLTTQNLNKHNRLTNKQVSHQDIENILSKKMKDFGLCKEAHSQGQGRAVRRISKSERNARNSNEYNSPDRNKESEMLETKDINSQSFPEMDRRDEAIEELQVLLDYENTNSPVKRCTHKKKYKSESQKPPEYDANTQMRVVFSPPGVDRTKLVPKVIPKYETNDNNDTNAAAKAANDDYSKVRDPKDMFGEVDSIVDVAITNKDVLRQHTQNTEIEKQDQRAISESPKNKASNVSDVSSSDGSSRNRILLQKLKQRVARQGVDKNSECNSSDTNNNAENLNKDTGSSTSNVPSSTNTPNKDSTNTTTNLDSDDDEDVTETIKKYTTKLTTKDENAPNNNEYVIPIKKKNHVNPFENVDQDKSVFVEKLIKPVLMVHTKNNSRIEPNRALSEIPFNVQVYSGLRNMKIDAPMTIQSVSWMSILRGFSAILIGPQGSGKTMGYLPPVCRLIADFDNDIVNSVGPTCIIVAATAQAVAAIYHVCKMLLGTKEKIFSCYAGMDLLSITTSLLNGCELFICTPCVLIRLLLQTDFGLDLRRLTTFVLDDCERLEAVYKSEIKVALSKVKEMLKARVNKEVKVQYILASRVWCAFMEPLAKRAPNTVICIGAFQECVLYSKAQTTVDLVKPENKDAIVLDFLEKNDKTKKTVIVCRTDEEVNHLEKVLKEKHTVVYACNNEMTLEGLRTFNVSWNEYADPTIGAILVCRDSNLSHMNITDAHNLVHYSMPELWSRFCKRFCALNDHYPSIFREQNEKVSIKIILEESNAEQLPKICHFIKRCTKAFPNNLDNICKEILTQKDLVKAENLVPICSNLLALGECPDFQYCKERHTSSQIHDEPKHWIPTDGIITFRILHYESAVIYSVRLLSNVQKGETITYPQTYSTLSFKMGTYFSQESNRKLVVPKVGDFYAVSINQNFYVRCQVIKILDTYRNGLPNNVLIKLIDEEQFETTRDIYLYHLPHDFKKVETYVAQVSLAGVVPKDKDITFSELAKEHVEKAVEKKNDSVYMRGKVVLTVGNRIFVDNIDVCQDLTSINEVVVKNNFKSILERHSELFHDHIKKLKGQLFPNEETPEPATEVVQVEEIKPVKEMIKIQWAHLNAEDLSWVYFTLALDPGTFFVRLANFASTLASLCKDIDKYLENNGSKPLDVVKENDIVLAKSLDNDSYERARVDSVESKKAKCFFVDYGEWRDVPLKDLTAIPEKFIRILPFQAIECRLYGIKPLGDNWTEFSTNWLCDRCDVDNGNVLKGLYVQYFSIDMPKFTGGKKYAVALLDTNGETDIVYNQQMVDLNLAAPDDTEFDILKNTDFTKSTNDEIAEENEDEDCSEHDYKSPKPNSQLIRTMPLIAEEDDSDFSDSDWSINMPQDFLAAFKCESTKSSEMTMLASANCSVHILNNTADSASEYEDVKKPEYKALEFKTEDMKSLEMPNPTLANSSVDSLTKTCDSDINMPEDCLAVFKGESTKSSEMAKLKSANSSVRILIKPADSASEYEDVKKPEYKALEFETEDMKSLEMPYPTSENSSVDSLTKTSDSASDQETVKMPENKALEGKAENMKSLEKPKLTSANSSDDSLTKTSDSASELESKAKDTESLEKPKLTSGDSSFDSLTKMDDSISEYVVIKKPEIKDLDSDDLSSASGVSSTGKPAVIKETNQTRKPKLLWRQNRTSVTIKIMLIGAEDYTLVVHERSMEFSSDVNDTFYNFTINLYGLVDKSKATHSYKGQYILVKLFKVIHKSWLTLTKESSLMKWIVYDHDSIDTSSDEEDVPVNPIMDIVKNIHREESDSDEDFRDDAAYDYPS